MSKLVNYKIDINRAKLRKLVAGNAIILNSKNFIEDSPYLLKVMPNTARRIQTALRKSKGVKISLKPEEDIVRMTTGGAISLKKIGKTISKGVKNTAGVIKRGFNKEIVESGVGKEIAKQLIDTGTNFVLPTALSAASMMAGDPTGKSGELVGNIAGNQLDKLAEKHGYGVFKTARKLGLNKVGINKKSVTKVGKEIGKTVVRQGAQVVGEAISAYTGNPAAGMAFERIAVAGADAAIDSGSAKKALRASKKVAKMVAVEAVDDIIDKNLSGVERDIAQKALAGEYPTASDLIYDYSNAKIPEAFVGYGISAVPKRVRGGLRIGPKRIKNELRIGMGLTGFKVADDRSVKAPIAPSDTIQLGSPYQRINSASMSPFIPASPQLAGYKVGGSMYPAGKFGNGFVPAG